MAFLDENGLQEFAKLLVEKGEWLGASSDDNYYDYDSGSYGVRANYARRAEEAGYAEYASEASSANYLSTSRKITLSGDVTGSVFFDGGSNVTLNTTVVDDSHNHTISNIDYLQDALDMKLHNQQNLAVDALSKFNFTENAKFAQATEYTNPGGYIKFDGTQPANAVFYIGNDAVSRQELLSLDGVTSNIQTQLNNKSNTGHTHTALVNSKGGVVNLLYNTDSTYALVPKSTVDGTVYRTSLGRGGDEGFYNLWLEGKATIEGGTSIDGTNTFNGITTVYARIQPTNDDGYAINLGHSNNRWANIYSKTAINTGSDLNIKKNLAEIDDRYIKMFDLIQPYSYKFIDGTSGRTHTGFISQYVEQAMEQVGLKDTDLGFFCKDAMYEEIKDKDGNVVDQKPILDEDGNQKYFYSLRYEEYIAIMTEKIKRMEKRIDELESKLDKVEELEVRLAKLEA